MLVGTKTFQCGRILRLLLAVLGGLDCSIIESAVVTVDGGQVWAEPLTEASTPDWVQRSLYLQYELEKINSQVAKLSLSIHIARHIIV